MYSLTLNFPTEEQRDSAMAFMTSDDGLEAINSNFDDDEVGKIEVEFQDDDSITYSSVSEEDSDK